MTITNDTVTFSDSDLKSFSASTQAAIAHAASGKDSVSWLNARIGAIVNSANQNFAAANLTAFGPVTVAFMNAPTAVQKQAQALFSELEKLLGVPVSTV
jgi:hypothetical protein